MSDDKQGTEVAAKDEKSTEVATAGKYDYGEMSGEGTEGVGVDDINIPFFSVLQNGSPQVEDQSIKDCKPGDIINSVTQEILTQPIGIIPVHHESAIVEWKPRKDGSGFVARHEPDWEVWLQCIKDNGGSMIPPVDDDGKRTPFKNPDNGNELIDTKYLYVLTLDKDNMTTSGFGCIAFSSTKIKVFRNLLSTMFGLKNKPPVYAFRFALTSVSEKNNLGSFYNFHFNGLMGDIKSSLIPNEAGKPFELLQEGRELMKAIKSGIKKADFDSLERDSEIAESGNDSPGVGATEKGVNTSDNSDDVPF